jgi:hypothetical protein
MNILIFSFVALLTTTLSAHSAITTDDAVEIVWKTLGQSPGNNSFLFFDREDQRNGKNYFVLQGYNRVYDPIDCTGTIVECTTQSVSISSINGSSSITVPSGTSFNNCEFITLVFSQFIGTDPNYPIITGDSSSLIYKITSISGNTLFIDRPTPILTGCTGNAQVICNSCENEYPLGNDYNTSCRPVEIDPSQQLNSWKMELVWGDKDLYRLAWKQTI